MKKLSPFLSLLLTITLFSCGSDDVAPIIENNSDLIGLWELTSITEIGVEEYVLDRCQITSTLDFRANNTYSEKTFVEILENCQSDGAYDGTWSMSGDTLTLMFDEGGTASSITWKVNVNNEELTRTSDEIEETYRKK